GEFRVRTICSEEILATPFTARAAMRVKSGPPLDTALAIGPVRGAAAGGSDRLRDCASESAVECIRPVMTTPATRPAATRTVERTRLRNMIYRTSTIRRP